MAVRPTVGAGAPTSHSTSHSTSSHAHVMHMTSHVAGARVRRPKAHKMHKPRKPSRTMRDSLLHISNQDVWRGRGRAAGQR